MNDTKQLLREKLKVLDGARGLAILLVVAFHYVPGFSFGWMGVDLFFVLSGFLITGKLLESVGQPRYFARFYVNRILRIVPLYFAVLIVFFVLLPLFGSLNLPGSYKELESLQGYYWTFTINIYNAFHGWPENITIVHFWSLAAEMQFYLIWPFVILWLNKSPRLLLMAIIVLILVAVLFRFIGQDIFPNFHFLYRYTFLLSRFDAFGAGALLYVVFSGKLIPASQKYVDWIWIVVLIAIIIIVVVAKLDWHYSEEFVMGPGYFLNAMLWAFLLFYCLSPKNSIVKKFFESQTMGMLGKYSYAIYIFHLPVWIIVSKLNWINELSNPYRQITLILLSATISFILSVLSYYLLEKPFLGLKSKLK